MLFDLFVLHLQEHVGGGGRIGPVLNMFRDGGVRPSATQLTAITSINHRRREALPELANPPWITCFS